MEKNDSGSHASYGKMEGIDIFRVTKLIQAHIMKFELINISNTFTIHSLICLDYTLCSLAKARATYSTYQTFYFDTKPSSND